MMTETEELIKRLTQLESISGMNAYRGQVISYDDGIPYPQEAKSLMKGIDVLAEYVLITNEGKPHPGNIRQLSRAGFRVSPGDKDAFGWLTGVITTRVGKIVFG